VFLGCDHIMNGPSDKDLRKRAFTCSDNLYALSLIVFLAVIIYILCFLTELVFHDDYVPIDQVSESICAFSIVKSVDILPSCVGQCNIEVRPIDPP